MCRSVRSIYNSDRRLTVGNDEGSNGVERRLEGLRALYVYTIVLFLWVGDTLLCTFVSLIDLCEELQEFLCL